MAENIKLNLRPKDVIRYAEGNAVLDVFHAMHVAICIITGVSVPINNLTDSKPNKPE